MHVHACTHELGMYRSMLEGRILNSIVFLILFSFQYPNYHEVVSSPMDLHTIKQKIKNGKFTSLGDFVQDVHLIFSNCLLYHKRHSQIGKAGVNLRTYFENRCSDLGFDDLGLLEREKNTDSGQGKPGRRSSRQK